MGLPEVNSSEAKSADVFVEALTRPDPFLRRVETLLHRARDPAVFIESTRPGGLIIRCSRRSKYGQEIPKRLCANRGRARRFGMRAKLLAWEHDD